MSFCSSPVKAQLSHIDKKFCGDLDDSRCGDLNVREMGMASLCCFPSVKSNYNLHNFSLLFLVNYMTVVCQETSNLVNQH